MLRAVTRNSSPQAASVETQQTDFERKHRDFDEMRQFRRPPACGLQMIFNCWKCEEGQVIYYRTRTCSLHSCPVGLKDCQTEPGRSPAAGEKGDDI